jgi:hypothetical protein
MDNIPSLQFGFDGHYVVYLRGAGGEIPPVYPTLYFLFNIQCARIISTHLKVRFHKKHE